VPPEKPPASFRGKMATSQVKLEVGDSMEFLKFLKLGISTPRTWNKDET
jgi:hypothetical protein